MPNINDLICAIEKIVPGTGTASVQRSITTQCKVDDVAGDGSNLVQYYEFALHSIDNAGLVTTTSLGNYTDETRATVYNPANPKTIEQIGTLEPGSSVLRTTVQNGATFRFPPNTSSFSYAVQTVGNVATPPRFVGSDGVEHEIVAGESAEDRSDGFYSTPPQIRTGAGDIVRVQYTINAKGRIVRILGGAPNTSSVKLFKVCGEEVTVITGNPVPDPPPPPLQLASLSAVKSGSIVDNNPTISRVSPGDQVRWAATITNSGAGPATNVTITDQGVAHPSPPATIAPGGSLNVPITPLTTITQAMIDGPDGARNSASLSYNDGEKVVTTPVSGQVDIASGGIRFNLREQSKTGTAVGDTITYELEYVNLGNTTHSNVSLVDADGISFGAIPATLAPGTPPVLLTGTHVITAAEAAAGRVSKQVVLGLKFSPSGFATQVLSQWPPNGQTPTITVLPTAPNSPPVATNPGAQVFNVGVPVNFQVPIVDPEGRPMAWEHSLSATAGQLEPLENSVPGLTFDVSTGIISGTPTQPVANVQHNFLARDDAQQTAFLNFGISVV